MRIQFLETEWTRNKYPGLSYMTTRYRSIYPLSQKASYVANNPLDWVLTLDKEKLLPDTVHAEGEIICYSTGTTPVAGQDIFYDPKTGYQALFRDITTIFRNTGDEETILNYPRLVKMESLARIPEESYGTETDNCIEGRAPTREIVRGYLRGQSATNKYIPFSVKLHTLVNRASAPLSSTATGQIAIRMRLAPNSEFFFGTEYDSANTTYAIKNLKLTYQVIPDDGKLQPVVLNYYHSDRAILDSNNQNISSFVPGDCDTVHISFINESLEQTSTANYLMCSPPPGIPPLGYSDDSITPSSYGLERVYYAVNDTDTALVGYTLESREEIIANGLRSFDPRLRNYSTLQRLMRDPVYPDGYLAGINFGTSIDFSRQKFAAEMQSQCSNSNVYAAYLFFSLNKTIMA